MESPFSPVMSRKLRKKFSEINSELYFDEDSDYGDDDDKEKMDKLKCDTVEFINSYPNIRVEKNWDIDIEGFDRPDSIEVLIQKKNNGSWENARLVELSSSNDWKESICFEDDPNREGEYRVRELKEESAPGSSISDRIIYDEDDSDKGEGATNQVALSGKIRIIWIRSGQKKSPSGFSRMVKTPEKHTPDTNPTANPTTETVAQTGMIKTGDDSSILLWTLMMFGSAVLLAGCVKAKKRKR